MAIVPPGLAHSVDRHRKGRSGLLSGFVYAPASMPAISRLRSARRVIAENSAFIEALRFRCSSRSALGFPLDRSRVHGGVADDDVELSVEGLRHVRSQASEDETLAPFVVVDGTEIKKHLIL